MLKVGAIAAVFGDCGPMIIEHARTRFTGVDHGLDSEHHAFAQLHSRSVRAVVRDLWIFVQLGPDTVSYELADHAEAVGFNHVLHGGADISDGVADAHLLDSALQRSFCDFQQLLELGWQRFLAADCHRDRGVSVISIEDDATIDRDDVTGLELALFRRDTVHDLVVDRSAKNTGIVVISLERGNRARFQNLFFRHALQVHGADPGSNDSAGGLEHLADDLPAAAHFFEFRTRLTHDRHPFSALPAQRGWNRSCP